MDLSHHQCCYKPLGSIKSAQSVVLNYPIKCWIIGNEEPSCITLLTSSIEPNAQGLKVAVRKATETDFVGKTLVIPVNRQIDDECGCNKSVQNLQLKFHPNIHSLVNTG